VCVAEEERVLRAGLRGKDCARECETGETDVFVSASLALELW